MNLKSIIVVIIRKENLFKGTIMNLIYKLNKVHFMEKESKSEKSRKWYLKKKERFGIRDRSSLKLSDEERSRRRKESKKRYREKNREKILRYKKEYYKNNKGKYQEYAIENKLKISNRNKERYNKNINHNREIRKVYSRLNRKRIYKRDKSRKEHDIVFRISSRIRQSISTIIKRNRYSKDSKTIKILGCSFQEFKIHIESKFEPWMNWDNYGKYNGEFSYGWDIDHIIPVSSANNEEEIINLNNYRNLQPLCSKINRYIKKDRIDNTNFIYK